MGNSRFDEAVVNTLRGLYCEMLNPQNPQQSTQLSETEKEAVDDAVHSAQDGSVTPDQKRLADLAARRKQQFQQVGRTATQKLQRAISQPITQ